jgi:uncharacterized protein YndB with AHSA1/START domain
MSTDQIEKRVLLRAPSDRVWRAISDSVEFGTWFGMKLDGPFKPGAKVRGAIVPTKVDPEVAAAQKAYEGHPVELIIERMEPERLFSFRWHPSDAADPPTLVVFALEEVADGVMLTLTESGFDQIPIERRAKAFTANEGGWTRQMHLIEAYLAQTP